MSKIIYIPTWDKYLLEHVNQNKNNNFNIKTWIPTLTHQKSLNPYQLIHHIFSSCNDTNGSYLVSFLCYGRNYFAPPSNTTDATNILTKVSSKRLKIFYGLKNEYNKTHISCDWVVFKNMQEQEIINASQNFLEYYEFIHYTGRKFILKSGSNKTPEMLLYNNLVTNQH